MANLNQLIAGAPPCNRWSAQWHVLSFGTLLASLQPSDCTIEPGPVTALRSAWPKPRHRLPFWGTHRNLIISKKNRFLLRNYRCKHQMKIMKPWPFSLSGFWWEGWAVMEKPITAEMSVDFGGFSAAFPAPMQKRCVCDRGWPGRAHW